MTTSTERVQAHRRRLREARILLPRREVSRDQIDILIDARVLGEWDDDDPQAIADAIIRLLNQLRNDVTE
jgi:hypothetical protein